MSFLYRKIQTDLCVLCSHLELGKQFTNLQWFGKWSVYIGAKHLILFVYLSRVILPVGPFCRIQALSGPMGELQNPVIVSWLGMEELDWNS